MNDYQIDGIKEAVRGFITSSVALPKLKDDDDLFESGVVNSLYAVQLMTFIERQFGIEVEQDDLDLENFKSIDAMTTFVMRKNRVSHA